MRLGFAELPKLLSRAHYTLFRRNFMIPHEIINLKSWHSETIQLGKIEIEGKRRRRKPPFLMLEGICREAA